ncbi:DNA translocase FtsK 4TM domain-containing protein, partial [Roseateles sp. GG27B]
MSFPLGSLSRDADADAAPAASDKVYKRQAKKASAPPAVSHNPLRTPAWLLVGALLWCLTVLALLTHDPADAAFSISGSRELFGNRMGAVGAWVADILLFCFGYSTVWLPLLGLRWWLASLADLLRADQPTPAPTWRLFGLGVLGVLLLLSASCALEWSRLYLWES